MSVGSIDTTARRAAASDVGVVLANGTDHTVRRRSGLVLVTLAAFAVCLERTACSGGRVEGIARSTGAGTNRRLVCAGGTCLTSIAAVTCVTDAFVPGPSTCRRSVHVCRAGHAGAATVCGLELASSTLGAGATIWAGPPDPAFAVSRLEGTLT